MPLPLVTKTTRNGQQIPDSKNYIIVIQIQTARNYNKEIWIKKLPERVQYQGRQ